LADLIDFCIKTPPFFFNGGAFLPVYEVPSIRGGKNRPFVFISRNYKYSPIIRVFPDFFTGFFTFSHFNYVNRCIFHKFLLPSLFF